MIPATPLYFVFRMNDTVHPWFWVGCVIVAFGVVMEAIADQQLYNFIQKKIAYKRQMNQRKQGIQISFYFKRNLNNLKI